MEKMELLGKRNGGSQYYVTAYSEVAHGPKKVRGVVLMIPEDYSLGEDAPWCRKLKEAFYEAVKDQCTCRAQYDDFLPDRITILGLTPVDLGR